MKHLYVDESPVHGKGLFTKKAIRRGDLIGRCKVKAVTPKHANAHTLTTSTGTVDVLNKLKWINHGRPGNCLYYDDLTVVATADIPKGTELLADYGEEW